VGYYERDDKPADLNPDWSQVPPDECERYRRWYNRRYRDPVTRLRELWPYMFADGKEATLFAPDQRSAEKLSEEFVGTLFVYALSEKYEGRHLYSSGETDQREGDGIRLYDKGSEFNLRPVQVKQVRSPVLSRRTLSHELTKIAAKYPRSPELEVVVSLRMDGKYPFAGVEYPKMEVGALYCLIALDDRLARWALAGDLLLERGDIYFEFDFPGTGPGAS
jgi:hypothetical protein